MTKPSDAVQVKPIQVEVTSSFEDAYRRFKALVQKERIAAQVKEKMAYVKPSERKRKKRREAESRRILQTHHEKLVETGEWDRRKKRKEQKKAEKAEYKIKKQENLV